jgi:hypothetical protein
VAEEGASRPHDEGRGVKRARTFPVYAAPDPRNGAPLGIVVGKARLGPDGTLTVRLRTLPLDGVLRIPGVTT